MRQRRDYEDDALRKFIVGETVYSKANTGLKMTVIRYSGKCYYCVISNAQSKNAILFFEDDLISEWQIPFY